MIFTILIINSDQEETINEEELSISQDEPILEGNKKPLVIIIDVKGSVKNPGIYSFEEGTRIYQAIEMAGGVTENASTDKINLAQIITDQMLLYIPNREEIKENNFVEEESTSDKISLNSADPMELMELPGIGEKKANQIIQHREEIGGFTTIEQIMEVTGIGDKTFEAIRELISL